MRQGIEVEESHIQCLKTGFGQTADAAYAVRCPIGHKADLEVLLKQTTLIAAPSAE